MTQLPPVVQQASEYGHLTWFKSTRSGQQNGCVSVAHTDVQTAVRDSKNPTGPAFAVRSDAWTSFIAAVR
ncbi:DUF397 domain-containing protein [Embleya sp. AB8]|uniref:DUF397 domain-containing protein n=1 Tax=Embleya sp. AB8 TaxID=3156304 RepID=UPI003C71FA5F